MKISVYDGMGGLVRVVEGTVLSTQWMPDEWRLATIQQVDGNVLVNQYIKATTKTIAAE